ncbi:MAG: hypothetical protein N4A33_02310 [Bacteriovoracaceae bacterium]|jgi:hypothetical protein|nr:hypothetical protein [Bacteriovoracaceae bacterium]
MSILNSVQKALKINLDAHIYGTFAEIGAGQEVANNFFKAGAASGTIAKTICAYDMIFSDSIYGKEESGRYVCKSRVQKMLDYEYDLVVQRLGKNRPDSKFFCFADTVSARNYKGTNEQHGWLGLKFQSKKSQQPSQIIVHTRMHDNTNLLQQKALGTLGTNIVYSSFYNTDKGVKEFVNSLMENLSTDRIEIDLISCSGPAFESLDERLLNLQLVESQITDAVVFDTCGKITLASDELYKKNILIARGSYRPPTLVNMDILSSGLANFSKDIESKKIVSLAEITISQLQHEGKIPHDDFLARVDLLASLGQMVMISSFKQYYKLSNFLYRFKPVNVALVLGTYNFMQIFDREYNQDIGKTLEAIGMLLRDNTKVYLYPYVENEGDDKIISLDNISVSKKNGPLLEYIRNSGHVKNLGDIDESILHIYSRKVLQMILDETQGWEKLVPLKVAQTIKDKCLFGINCSN